MVRLGEEGHGITPVVLVGFRETEVRGSTLVGLVLMLVLVLVLMLMLMLVLVPVSVEAFPWMKSVQEAGEMAMVMARPLHALQN